MVTPSFWAGKRVFITGHTGFKGGWLALWLQKMGAIVTGYALPPSTIPNFFEVAEVDRGMNAIMGDIRDHDALQNAITSSQPQVVFHLAAQALVGTGYSDPLGTFSTNIQGTAILLECLRNTKSIQAVVVVTSDKCYENKEWPWPYRENEPLGGRDPYSSSKACAELVTAAYRDSFLRPAGIAVATARSGNVFGGGDWSANRLVPDLLAAFSQDQTAQLRRPYSTRPWQHVLEPLAGYLMLAEKLCTDNAYSRAWNFGPGEEASLLAGELADQLAKIWGENASWHAAPTVFPHEAETLQLDSTLARKKLDWHGRWSLTAGLSATIFWHKSWLTATNMREYTLKQIEQYSADEYPKQ